MKKFNHVLFLLMLSTSHAYLCPSSAPQTPRNGVEAPPPSPQLNHSAPKSFGLSCDEHDTLLVDEHMPHASILTRTSLRGIARVTIGDFRPTRRHRSRTEFDNSPQQAPTISASLTISELAALLRRDTLEQNLPALTETTDQDSPDNITYTAHQIPQWLKYLTVAGATTGINCLTVKLIQHRDTRIFPGMDTVATSSLQSLGAAASGATFLILTGVAWHKFTNLLYAPWKTKLKDQERSFVQALAEQGAQSTQQLNDFQRINDTRIAAIAERENNTEEGVHTLALQTRAGFDLHSTQLALFLTALDAADRVIATIVPVMQARAVANSNTSQPASVARTNQQPTDVEVRTQNLAGAMHQLREAQQVAPPVIDESLVATRFTTTPTPPALVPSAKIKPRGNCCC